MGGFLGSVTLRFKVIATCKIGMMMMMMAWFVSHVPSLADFLAKGQADRFPRWIEVIFLLVRGFCSNTRRADQLHTLQ